MPFKIALQKKLFVEIFFSENSLSEGWDGIGLESFLYKLMVDLYIRPGTDVLSTDSISVCRFFMSSDQRFKRNIFTPLFLKFETSVSQIAIAY